MIKRGCNYVTININFKSIMGIIVEHNRAEVLALEHSIIGKGKKSIICILYYKVSCMEGIQSLEFLLTFGNSLVG